MDSLDPHERPPQGIRAVYKKYQKSNLQDLNQDSDIVDLQNGPSDLHKSKLSITRELCPRHVADALKDFAGAEVDFKHVETPFPVYEHRDMPGLHIIPSLLPPEIQILLLSRLLHRDLSNPVHLTNIHTHYDLSYPPSSSSFFSLPPTQSIPLAKPLDPAIHKPFTVSQILAKKLRWMTLGGQYDWTEKKYPVAPPPPFSPDVKHLLESIFPETKAEAAIVNLYSPGDTLSVHRDVAESCSTGLISLSLGCDAIFVIGTETQDKAKGKVGEKVLALRLQSGSAVYMSGPSRFAWHGVPQVVKDTCPAYLRDWPANVEKSADGTDPFEPWKGWMNGKRINVNVRQMM